MKMESEDIYNRIKYFKEKIEFDANCKDIKSLKHYIVKFGELNISAKHLIEQGLVQYMKNLGHRFRWLKEQTDLIANKWQQKIDLKLNNKLMNAEKSIQPVPLQKNGSWKSNLTNSERRHSYASSSSQELERSASQKHNSFNHKPNNQDSLIGSSSDPLGLEIASSQMVSSSEFNANLSIDPKEIIPSNRTNISPVKSNDPFARLKQLEGKCWAVKLDEKPLEKNLETLWCAFTHIKVPITKFPRFLREYDDQKHQENSNDSKCSTLNKKIDSHHSPSKSHKVARASSENCPQSRHDRKRKSDEAQPGIKFRESKKEQGVSISGPVKPKENSVSAAKSKELIKEAAQDHKLKHSFRNQSVANGKSAEERVMAFFEISTDSKHAQEVLRSEQNIHGSNLNLDTKWTPEARNVEKNNKKRDSPDQNAATSKKEKTSLSHGKKSNSPDQSAMMAITSSKKERTSMYHGGKKSEMPKLKDLAMQLLLRAIKRSDPSKYINKNVNFEVLEPILEQISPEKLRKIEEDKKYLLSSTDPVWKLNCERRFKSSIHQKRKNETWREFFNRRYVESNEKLKNLTASITASASKVKPDRQIKLTTAEGPPSKRQKSDHTIVTKSNGHISSVDVSPVKRQKTDNSIAAKCNGNISTVKYLPNNNQPSISRPVAPIPSKVSSNHKTQKTTKKDAPLMHKVKKTMNHLNQIRRS